MLNHPASVLIIAFMLDSLLGDPPCPLHPVRLMGHAIKGCERIMRQPFKQGLRLTGTIMIIVLASLSLGIYSLSRQIVPAEFHAALNIVITYSLLALKDMTHHVQQVQTALEINNLHVARHAVQQIIGRDANQLDQAGVGRAAVESLAENFVDGFLSPIFWFSTGALIGGTPLGIQALIVFKLISTLDSMVGYQNDRYRDFGYCSAKLDDLLNFIPARLSIPLLTLAARLTRQQMRQAWLIGWRDRLKHASPNSAHAEAAIAGALNLMLAGPAIYPSGPVEKPWIGDGNDTPSPATLRTAITLINTAGFITITLATTLLITSYSLSFS